MILFPIRTYPARALVVLAAATVGLPLALIALALAAADVLPSWLFILGVATGIGMLLAANAALTCLAVFAATRNEVTVRDATLHLKGGAFHERIPLDSIFELSVVDFTQRPDLARAKRRNGILLPGFRLGWFETRHGELVFTIAGGGRQRAVYLRSSREFSVVLAVEDPDNVAAALASPATQRH